MKITTTYKTNAQGTGQIVAKSSGKQRTHNYDLANSVATNHGYAAAHLLIDKFPEAVKVAALGSATHDSNEAGTVHTFEV